MTIPNGTVAKSDFHDGRGNLSALAARIGHRQPRHEARDTCAEVQASLGSASPRTSHSPNPQESPIKQWQFFIHGA